MPDQPSRVQSISQIRDLTHHELDDLVFVIDTEDNFRFVADSTEADDGVNWIRPANILPVNPGRWKRVLIDTPDLDPGVSTGGSIEILDDGSTVAEGATKINFGDGLEPVPDGEGRVRVNALPGSEDAPGIVQFATNGEVADLKAVKANDSRIPTQDEKEALAGTAGPPNNSNRVVTDDDPRLVSSGGGAAVTPVGAFVISQGDSGVLSIDLVPGAPISAIMYRQIPVGEGEAPALLLREEELPETIELQTASSGSVTIQVQALNDGAPGRVKFEITANTLTADDVSWPVIGLAAGDIPIYQSKLFIFGDITDLKGSYSPNQANREVGNLRFGHYVLTTIDGVVPFQSVHVDGHKLGFKGSTDVGGVGAAGWEDPETGTGAPGVPGQAGQPVEKTWGHFPDAIRNIAFRGNLAATLQGDTLIIDASGGGGGGVNLGIAEIVGLGFAPVDDMAPVDPEVLPTGEDMVENVDGLDVDDDEPESVIQLRYLKGGTPAPGITPVDILSTDTWEEIVQKVADTINGLGKPISAAAYSNYLRVTRAKQSSVPLTVVYSTDGKIQAQPVLPGIGPNDPGGHKVYTANISLSPLGINPQGVMLVNEAPVASQNMAVGDKVLCFQDGANPLIWHCSQFSTWE
ncbi:MAG: hypothetical protein LLG93_07610 [Deltaproteobacteria bacterium]|nr:hypothetical protein [Deltaproteobacteria bacterium]